MRKHKRSILFIRLALLTGRVITVASLLTGFVFLFIEPVLGTIILMLGFLFAHISESCMPGPDGKQKES